MVETGGRDTEEAPRRRVAVAGEPPAPPAPRPPRPRSPWHVVAYVLSLPERLLRWIVAGVGSLLLLLTGLLPRPLRETKFYRLSVERQIRILTDDVGRAGLFAKEEAMDASKATRMAVGGAIDNVVMLGLHVSPMWILFAATDVSEGARAFVREIGRELKEAGVIEQGASLDSVDAVLGGLSRLSDGLADNLDMPPLSVADMKAAIASARDDLGALGGAARQSMPDVDALAGEVRKLAHESQRSLLETSSALAVGAAARAGRLAHGVLVGTGATVGLVGKVLWRDVLLDYASTVRTAGKRGLFRTLRGTLRPQARSRRRLFRYPFVTLTEQALSLGRWRKAPWRAS